MKTLIVLALVPMACLAQSAPGLTVVPGGGTMAQAGTSSQPRGLDFDVFIRLQAGMSEGELLLRAGRPDSESVENFRNDIVKTYYYFPTASNPWVTAITLRGGKIVNIDRTKKFF